MLGHPENGNLPPLTEATFYILLALVPDPAHGYGILKDVQRLSNGTINLSTSTLYTALGRLLEDGLIERVDNPDVEETNRPRKAYRLSAAGKIALEGEVQRMQRLVMAALQRTKEAEA